MSVRKYYDEATLPYLVWSKKLNIHFGFFRLGINPFSLETLLVQMTKEALNRLNLSTISSPTLLDIGCGYGGLLFGLAPVLPNKRLLGLEIRDKLVNYVAEKIRGYRIKNPGVYDNISVVRTNTMRHLGQYFPRASLDKIFICCPNPHFKAKNYRRRIINTGFLSEYAYLLKPKGLLYCITDVLELHEWHMDHLRSHRMFRELKGYDDPCVQVMRAKTDEGQKVERN